MRNDRSISPCSFGIDRHLSRDLRFYAAEVCLALKWFHDTGLLYRNLCLNDILLGLDGHIKLVDFIVSKIGLQPESKTKSFCGSSEFMAPEVSVTGHESHDLKTVIADHDPKRCSWIVLMIVRSTGGN